MTLKMDLAARAGRTLLAMGLCLTAVLTASAGVAAASEGRQTLVRADSVVLADAAIPDRAWNTLALIDAGQWPPNDDSGTRGGATFSNRDRSLPATDADGNPIAYQVWDVNIKQPGQLRDSERIVTGRDGSAWYSPDGFRSFVRMR